LLVVALVVMLSAAAAPGKATSVRLAVPAGAPLYSARTIVRGRVLPAAVDVNLALELRTQHGWVRVARARTVREGRFAASLVARRGGRLRAVVLATGVASLPVRLRVRPKVRVVASPGRAFVGAPLVAHVVPASFDGTAEVVVWRNGPPLATVRARIRNGVARVSVPTPGLGRFSLAFQLGPGSGLRSTTVLGSVRASARTLTVGSRGPDVAALARRLAELRFHVPGLSETFVPELYDSVIAFQKAFGLTRDGVVGRAVWAALGRARVLRPHYAGPSPHIEVDKGHQLLLVVRGGEVSALVPVSTGASGNTPVGQFHILWKAPATGTWLGSAILYRTLTFHGNFAIHGFYSVPAYPASHGCVRVPIWAADWLYNQSPVGETVYVYE
jgi:hypothetical protein